MRVRWTGRAKDTTSKLGEIREGYDSLLSDKKGALPSVFSVERRSSLVGAFASPKKFVEIATKFLPKFYEDVGQNLKAWTPKPPRVKKEKTEKKEDIIEISDQLPGSKSSSKFFWNK